MYIPVHSYGFRLLKILANVLKTFLVCIYYYNHNIDSLFPIESVNQCVLSQSMCIKSIAQPAGVHYNRDVSSLKPVMWRSHQPRFHPDLNRGLYRERVGVVLSAPIRSYHVLMSILTIGFFNRGKFFGCQKIALLVKMFLTLVPHSIFCSNFNILMYFNIVQLFW